MTRRQGVRKEGDKEMAGSSVGGDPVNTSDTDKASKYVVNLPEPHAANAEA